MTSATVDAFCSAVDDMPFEAIKRSVEQFGSGRVERNNSFPPAAAEFASNAREWQQAIDKRADLAGPELYSGLISMDFGGGKIDMRGLTISEQDRIIANKGRAPDGKPLAYLSLEQIKDALSGAPKIEGRSFSAPILGRMQ